MADKELFSLPEHDSTDIDGTMGVYLVDPLVGSRYVTLAELKTYINTDPTTVPASEPLRGARAVRTSTFTPSTGVNAISWNSDSTGDGGFDTDSIWDSGAPTRLTVPTGWERAALFAGIRVTGGSAVNLFLAIRKNGTDTFANTMSSSGFSNQGLQVSTGPIIVTAGDYFEATYEFSSVTSKTVQNEPRTFFSIIGLQVPA